MTIDQFNELSKERKVDIYLRFLPFIAVLETPEQLYLLYRHKELYVEVTFSHELVLQNIHAITSHDAETRYGVPMKQAVNS